MGLFLIIWILIMFAAILAPFDQNTKLRVYSILSIIITLFFIMINLDKHNFKLVIDKKITVDKTEILSFKNSDSEIKGLFTLGSGYINSSQMYSYFIENADGSKEKKFIQVKDTKIFEGDYTPSIEVSHCTDGINFSFLAGWYIFTDECSFKEIRKIFVPKGTVILDYNIN